MSKKKKFILQEVTIEKYAAEGKCIAYFNDKVLFVEGAVPGDIANVFVHKNKADYAEGKVNEIVVPSANRTPHFCHHFAPNGKGCGGCKWQMLPYHLQLEYKEQQVKDQLTRIGKVAVNEWKPIVGCAEQTHYRNKVEFTFSNKRYLLPSELNTETGNNENVLGYHAPKLFDKVIDIENCHLQAEPTNEIKNFIRAFALENNYTFHDIKNHTGELRNLIVRLASNGQILLNVVFGWIEKPRVEQMMEAIKTKFPTITSLQYAINEKMNDTIYDLPVHVYNGTNTIEENLGEFTFKISPKSFFQTNTKQAEMLYTKVKEVAKFTGTETLYDLYCGTGSIGIFCSKEVKKIIGVETVEDAIKDAKINAQNNQVENAHFFAGDVIKICTTDFFNTHGSPDVIIVDPPRAGMHADLVQKLLEIEAPKIVYVSCNPATQARDLYLLKEKYILEISQAVDMFPHTHHIENIVLLTLKK
jgi:23S rRNA (uracil1939-C5)-methyltransferase